MKPSPAPRAGVADADRSPDTGRPGGCWRRARRGGGGRSRRCRCRGGRPSRGSGPARAPSSRDRHLGRDRDVVEEAEAHRPVRLRRGGRTAARRRSRPRPRRRAARGSSRRRRRRRAAPPRRRPRRRRCRRRSRRRRRGRACGSPRRARALWTSSSSRSSAAGACRRSQPSQSRSASAASIATHPLGRLGVPGHQLPRVVLEAGGVAEVEHRPTVLRDRDLHFLREATQMQVSLAGGARTQE